MGFIEDFERNAKKEIEKCVSKEDKILVACSGGKDSTTLLYLLHKFGYNVEAIIINLKMGEWFEKNVENIKKFCKQHNIKLHEVNMRELLGSMCYIRSCIQSKVKLSNCAICGVIKRYLLNKYAKMLGATKLATGHNRDDLVESIFMNLIMNNHKMCLNLVQTNENNDVFIKKVKPLNYISEKDIKKYSKLMNFPVIYDPSPCSFNAFRRFVLDLIKKYKINEENVVKYFLTLLPKIKEKYKPKKLGKCKLCGEPSSGEICKTCQLISLIR